MEKGSKGARERRSEGGRERGREERGSKPAGSCCRRQARSRGRRWSPRRRARASRASQRRRLPAHARACVQGRAD
eukprot:6149190-Pleurochrysis_carterae.AAC.1